MLSKKSVKDLSCLGSYANTFRELEKELKKPEVQKRFAGNVHLLLGLYGLTVYKLAEFSGCSQSTLSRLLLGTSKFDRTSPLIFAAIAVTLKINTNTLLFVDLREHFCDLLKKLEEQ